MSLKIEDLAGVKLVQDENFTVENLVLDALEEAFIQGSQGWGVTRDTGVLLTLARELHAARLQADTAEDNYRLLKGAQMALGRSKKRELVLQEAVESLTVETFKLTGERDLAIAGRQDLAGVLNAEHDQKVQAQNLASEYMATIKSLRSSLDTSE